MQRLRSFRPSPGLVVAIAAVVLTSVGSATAAHLITGEQIKDGSIASRDIKNGSLTNADFKSGLRTGPRGPEGPAGAAGPRGARGDDGDDGQDGADGEDGADGFGGLAHAQSVDTFGDGTADITEAQCATSDSWYPTGGSAWAVDHATGSTDHPEVITAQGIELDDDGTPIGYFASVDNPDSGEVDVVVDVMCALVSEGIEPTGQSLVHTRDDSPRVHWRRSGRRAQTLTDRLQRER
jgi:Collagen triple helix repeat (20 copies)